MRVCVCGLWHLGSVTAACLAQHFSTTGYDPDAATIANLRTGRAPIFEPGLDEMIREGLSASRLSFADDAGVALDGADVVWITFDTPVDDDDVADTEFVERQCKALFPHLPDGTLLLISSQVPVGFTARMEATFRSAYPGRRVSFAYSPENLRLGKALDAFCRPERIVVGVRGEADKERLIHLLSRFSGRLEWMSVESAEMTKHALNGFMATSIAFINEVAALCERVGADAKEVERGLKSDPRIGSRAYLSPGGPFSGGTLARDIMYLKRLGTAHDQPVHLLSAVRKSNEAHRLWSRDKLRSLLGDLWGRRISVWGLTYKPGTDTLRRSASVELCEWLTGQGAEVHAHDPAVKALPDTLAGKMVLHPIPLDALAGASALVVATEWPEYRSLTAESVWMTMRTPVVIDPGGFLASALGQDARIRYVTVGRPCP
jgi:UDPglucose 6-dehydrogenase